MIRLAHFSDIHLSSPRLDWKLEDWFSKRFTSWVNYRLLGRARRFLLANDIVARLMVELLERGIDHLIFSGDATALGFEAEFRYTAEALRIGSYAIPGLAVPGNHDYCTPSAEASGAFERFFAPWQEGQRIDGHCYPFAQKAGAIWLIGVNAATGNRWPTDAGGTVGPQQLERLQRLLASLESGLKILVVHYPLCVSNGLPETKQYGLRDVNSLLEVANRGGVNLWLHGHRHTPYYLQQPAGAMFPVICAGSATQRHLWSYGEYTIEGTSLQALRRIYDPDARGFRDAESFLLHLGPEPAAPARIQT